MNMTREDLNKRVEELKAAIDQSAANHNALLGRYNEALFMAERMSSAEKICNVEIEEVVIDD